MNMENLKSNKDEDIEKICIAFGVSKAELKFKLKQLEAYTSLRHNKNINSLWKRKKLL
nr:MAG TPA: MarR family [Caudoviricetes sp.]